MASRKNRKANYNPDDDPWDDRALIQAYDNAVKLHTSLVNAPASVLQALQQDDTVPTSKKRQHFESTALKKSIHQSEEQEDTEESNEEEQEETSEANFDMEHQIRGMAPYGYTPFAPPYLSYPNAAYNPWTSGFGANTPTKHATLKRSKLPNSRSQSNPMGVLETELALNNHQEGVNGGICEEDEFSGQIPKAKRTKRFNDGTQESNAAYSLYSPMGLQPPRIGEVPMGYQAGFPAQAPPPNWWSHMPGPWSHSSGSFSNTPDNSTLWAYYYYGYAMGQYDALKLKMGNGQ